MSWQVTVDVVGISLSFLGFCGSVASFIQSQKAAEQASDAKDNAEEAAKRSAEAVVLLRRDLKKGSILELLINLEALGSEMETLFVTGVYSSALLRARDISKELIYLIGRWHEVLPGTSLAAIADANAKTEQMRDLLQQKATFSLKEQGKLLGIVQSVSKSLATERAQAQKRKEENGRLIES